MHKRKFNYGFVLLLFLLLLIFFLPTRLIKIESIECQSQYDKCPESVLTQLEQVKHGSINKTKKEIANALNDNNLILDYSTQYAFPNKLVVNILLRKARFSIYDKETNKYFMLDGDGTILFTSDNTVLPTVIQNGQKVNLTALRLIEGVYLMYQVTKGEVVNDSLVVELPSGKSVIFPLEGDTEVLLGSLRLIYSSYPDRDIDLRFNDAVLR